MRAPPSTRVFIQKHGKPEKKKRQHFQGSSFPEETISQQIQGAVQDVVHLMPHPVRCVLQVDSSPAVIMRCAINLKQYHNMVVFSHFMCVYRDLFLDRGTVIHLFSVPTTTFKIKALLRSYS